MVAALADEPGVPDPAAPSVTPALFVTTEPITPVPAPPAVDPLKAALGEKLFATPLLSHDGQRSCLSCHDVRTNGADANRRDKDIDGRDNALNTNTVFNAALSFRFNWEGDSRSLADQAVMALESRDSMGQQVEDAVTKLQANQAMTALFMGAYGHPPDRDSLLDAIASYERTLVTPDSRFDRWLSGDTTALSADEIDGYRLFKSFGCITCHQGVNIGGNMYQRHGIFSPLASPYPEILRVPSLRNVATTPPYFHDGSAPSLNDAVRKMGVAQLNRALTDQQIDSIVAFLRSLTGTYRGTPVTGATP